MKRPTHIAADGRAQMVDVSAKPLSARTALAEGRITLAKETVMLIRQNQVAKGDVVERKPEQHDFRENYQPGRMMVAIGG